MKFFVKAQTNGNDFVILEDCDQDFEEYKLIADRRFGIGCDQVVVIGRQTPTKYGLKFYNSDGTEAAMCGNGACAAALYITTNIEKYDELTFEISGREYMATRHNNVIKLFVERPQMLYTVIEGIGGRRNGAQAQSYTELTDHVAAQDEQRIDEPANFRGQGTSQTPWYRMVSAGNQHVICGMEMLGVVTDLAQQFPECNVHFVENIDGNDQHIIRMKTFERGVGWTMSCGSGALAVVFADGAEGITKIIHDGGVSIVENHGDLFSLSVESRLVFRGEFYG
ncbi:MAG: diaminopimelate epimerase [Holosporales bacterium]|jgi:diaminopimelate epimerase|nr:diaminopimelate epimerase [Holosporales bacterium]